MNDKIMKKSIQVLTSMNIKLEGERNTVEMMNLVKNFKNYEKKKERDDSRLLR